MPMPGPRSVTEIRTSPSVRDDPHFDGRAGGRVLDGVVDQVAEHLTQPLWVTADGGKRSPRARAPAPRPARVAAATESRDERGEVDVGEAVAERSGVDARRVEHVADQRREPRRLVGDQRRGTPRAVPAAAHASAAAACAKRRSRPPSGCAARARRVRRSRRAAPRAAAAPRRSAARSRTRG